MALAFTVSAQNIITIVYKRKTTQVAPNHPRYKELVKALNEKDEDQVEQILTRTSSMGEWIKGKAQLKNGKIIFNGKETHNIIAERATELLTQGFTVDPLLRFMENIEENPSERAREELYSFLEHKNLPLTDDGHFLAYKALTSNMKDIYTNTIDNSIGRIVEFPRDQVDDDKNRTCSYGLHVGALPYVKNYGSAYGMFVIVKVNPKDAVAVPADHNAQKLRVCKYEVLCLLECDEGLQQPCYSSAGAKYNNLQDFDANQAWGKKDKYVEEKPLKDDRDLDKNLEMLEKIKAAWMEGFTRDEVVDYAQNWGVVKTKEEARAMGKEAVCSLLAAEEFKEKLAKARK